MAIKKEVTKMDQTVKGLSLSAGTALVSSGMILLGVEGREVLGMVMVMLGVSLPIAREFLLKK